MAIITGLNCLVAVGIIILFVKGRLCFIVKNEMIGKIVKILFGISTKPGAIITPNGSEDVIRYEKLTMTTPHAKLNINDNLGGAGFMVEYNYLDNSTLNIAFWRDREDFSEITGEEKDIAKSVGYQLIAEEQLSQTMALLTFLDKTQATHYSLVGILASPEGSLGGILMALREGQYGKEDLVGIYKSIKFAATSNSSKPIVN